MMAFGGCVLVTDPDALSAGCPEGEKLCEGICVSLTDEDFGCARAGCSPCDLPQATTRCGPSGQCMVSSCVGAWSDCDRDTSNGCEVDLDSDVNNCGLCGAVCEDPKNGEAACGGADCYVRRCEPPYLDCNFDFRDGCEVNTSNAVPECAECPTYCDEI
jgi:hypothetical protein